MCGINVAINGSFNDVELMQNATKNRGIRHNIYMQDNIHVAFSWLPITDKNAPMQPFVFNGYFVWLNGYISNYKELAKEWNWILKTNCDTEFLARFIAENKPTSLLNGFFSVFYINVKKKSYGCFNDRYGIKQLYEFREGNKHYISSELKGILALSYNFEVDQRKIDVFTHSLGVMNENTIFTKINRVKKLPFEKPKKIKISYEDAKQKLSDLWTKSVQRNKIDSDCVFLSGGIDSGIIAKHFKPEFSFSMDYIEKQFSEIENIKKNSEGIHYTMICNDKLIEKYKLNSLVAMDDFKAGSCFTNFALTELASKFCTVIYSGAGGDEVFGGYPHRNNKNIQNIIKRTNFNNWKQPKFKNISHEKYNWMFLDAVLVVEDRMAGFHTMETRYPLLDNDFVDFALSLPNEYLENKRILKDISGLSSEVLNSKKQGFSNPMTNENYVLMVLDEINKRYLKRQNAI